MNTTCRALTGVLLIAALSHGPQASAERAPEPPGAICVDNDGADFCYRFSGRVRFRHQGLSPFGLDNTGALHHQEQFFQLPVGGIVDLLQEQDHSAGAKLWQISLHSMFLEPQVKAYG